MVQTLTPFGNMGETGPLGFHEIHLKSMVVSNSEREKRKRKTLALCVVCPQNSSENCNQLLIVTGGVVIFNFFHEVEQNNAQQVPFDSAMS